MIEAQTFSELSEKFDVSGVPKIVINDEFELVPITHPFTQQTLPMLTIWPFEANSDGMFVAKMRRK